MTDRTLVAILTRERPQGLQAALGSIGRCERPHNVALECLVVDNDPGQSARELVERTDIGMPLQYLAEPRVGIPFARNRAIDAASDFDFVAFMDDDEIADVRWLVELHRVLAVARADAATGPVQRVLPASTPPWVRRGEFFERVELTEGTTVATAYTNNVLARMATIHDLSLRFDERFPLLGGEDTWFFEQMSEGGGRIVWVASAVVSETVPESRTTFRWLARRSYRIGLAEARRRQASSPGFHTATATLWLTVRRVGVTLRMLALTPREGRAGLARAAMKAATAVGGVVGMLGFTFDEYRTVDGK